MKFIEGLTMTGKELYEGTAVPLEDMFDTPTLQQPLYDYSKGKFYTTLKGRLFIEDEDATRK
jgi:hypothetical protein